MIAVQLGLAGSVMLGVAGVAALVGAVVWVRARRAVRRARREAALSVAWRRDHLSG